MRTVKAAPMPVAMTSACTTRRLAAGRSPEPSARAMAEDTPPPIAPAEVICSSMMSGNTSARPASGAVPSRPTKKVSPTDTIVWKATSSTPGADSRSSVGTRGADSRRSVRGFTAPILEEAELSRRRRRGAEPGVVERRRFAPGAAAPEVEAPAGGGEALRDQLCEQALALHPLAEIRVVLLAAAHLPHDAHDVPGTLRIVGVQPVLEYVPQLVGQAEDDVGGFVGAGRRRGLEHFLQRRVVEGGDQRADEDAAGNSIGLQRFQDVQPSLRTCRAGFELARQLAIQRRNGHEDLDQVFGRKIFQ